MRQASVFLFLPVIAASACKTEEQHTPLTSVGVFEVEGSQPFLDTGYDLVPGSFYMFVHRSGGVCFQADHACAPPRGSDVPGEEAWGLRVVLKDSYVPVRDRMILSVDETTPLVFYVPEGEEEEWKEDKKELYGDNSGSWTMEVVAFSSAPESDWTQGVNVTSYSGDGYCSGEVDDLLRRLKGLGANAVQLVVVYETDGESVYPVEFSPRSFCIVRATQAAHELGFKVGWNLHVDPPEDGWRGELQPKDKKAFFSSYRQFAVYWATLAREWDVEMLVPATEMVSLTEKEEDRNSWISIFLELHTIFPGLIYYAADRVEYARLDGDFWSACCDAIGVTPWFPLSDEEAPSAETLVAAWKEPVRELMQFSDAVKMRVYMPEGPGYRAVEKCAAEPADYLTEAPPSDLCQSEAYKAFLKVFQPSQRQMLAGYFLWEVRVPGEDGETLYSPLSRITESVLKQGWSGAP